MSEEELKKEGCCCGEHGDTDQCCGGHGDSDHCCGGRDNGSCCEDGKECACGHKHDEADEFDYEAHDVQLPKPTLITIVSTIAQQAMVSMGVLPNPATGKSVFLLNQATYLIDSVEVIAEKVKGNATDEETKMIENVLSELRMLYVAAANEKNRRAQEKK